MAPARRTWAGERGKESKRLDALAGRFAGAVGAMNRKMPESVPGEVSQHHPEIPGFRRVTDQLAAPGRVWLPGDDLAGPLHRLPCPPPKGYHAASW